MKKHTKIILENYEENKTLYADFNRRCLSLIKDLLVNEGINYHQITERVKEKNKLEGKILKKGHKYADISEITDVCGIRIISYFEDEIDKIANVIKSEFKIDIKNSIDKRQLESDRFGYRSLHYVVSLNDKRLRLSEYKRFSNLKFEIQIRTVLQHSWAEIEHDIGYKNDVAIPEFAKRTFYRVAALLETADLEFVKLKDILKEYEKSVGAEIDINPESVLVDQVSLLTYMTTSKRIIELDEEFSKWSKVPILDNDAEHSAGALSRRLIGVGITTIKQLDDFINHNSKELFELYKRDAVDFGPLSGLSKGMIIYQIDLYIKGKSAK